MFEAAAGELDEFRLVRLLGRGGMGEVFLGHDTVLDRPVAIKLIGSVSPDGHHRERFLNEARAVARLAHPNVVTIYRVGTSRDGRPFLVQELIRGRSLDKLARPVPWRQVCELGIGIARGLEAAHRRGILHRDIKPANIMLDDHGVTRLLDFGLAKLTGGVEEPWLGAPGSAVDPVAETPAAATPAGPAITADWPRDTGPAGPAITAGGSRDAGPSGAAVADDAPSTSPGLAISAEGPSPPLGPAITAEWPLAAEPPRAAPASSPDASPTPRVAHTAAGAMVGTPRYTAPERWRGEPSSAACDLYAFGVVLYELLTGAPPYPQLELAALRDAVLAGGARPVAELAPEVAPALGALVARCLDLDPGHRPGSAAELVHELEAMVADTPAVPEGNPYRGLRAFDAEHRGLFFGRGPDISALVDRLRSEPLIVVVGDSGIGKSSVCHAGVVPAVRAGALGDHRRWRVVSGVPGRRPWTALREALAIAPDDASARDRVRALRPPDEQGVLVVIDQLEELVTSSEPAEAEQVAALLGAIADGVPGVKALLCVRGDFLTRVAALPALGAPMTRGLHLLRVLSKADLREAVVGPPRATGVRFETEAMVGELVEAVAGNAGALPLLQFTLAELWQARAGAVIPARALAELGGVDGALAGHADAVLFALAADERAAARRILLRLVTAAGTRAIRDRDELVAGDPVAARAIESLVRGRLVVARDTVSGTPSYELAHEALIRGWGTLRDWLDGIAGQRAAHDRLIASASEWQRVGRRADLLWSRRQLDEVRGVLDLIPAEQAFLDASRRHVRNGRLARIAAIAALPLLALAIFVGLRLDAARTRDRAVAGRVEAARAHRLRADTAARDAAIARRDAFARFDASADADGEARWAEARRLASTAHAAYRDAAAELDAAQLIDAGTVSAEMAAVLASHARLAEAEHDSERLAELLRRLETYDSELAAGWSKPAHYRLELDRSARVSVHASAPAGAADPRLLPGRFEPAPAASGTGTRFEAELAPGSYVVVIEPRDGPIVRDPIFVEHGEQLTRRLSLPLVADVPAGFVYIPAGRFLFGSSRDDAVRRNYLRAQPLHDVETAAYLIARTEVTFAQWMDYLRALSAAELAAKLDAGATFAHGRDVLLAVAEHAAALPSNGVALTEAAGRFSLSLRPTTQEYRAIEGEALVYPERAVRRAVRWERLPVSGVSWRDGRRYAAWLDCTGRVPGARLCTVREWERAARGADGRSYPHGEALAPADANFDLTYGQKSLAFGPDEVGTHPESDSPFGVSDLAGNAGDWVRGLSGGAWMKGGAWYQNSIAALAPNGQFGEETQRDVRLGLRICADPAR